MTSDPTHPVLRNRADYRRAVRRAAELREAGETVKTCPELGALDGAIARYVAKPGEPARRRGRPKNGGRDTM